MSLLDYNAKRFCLLRALLWCGLLFGSSLCDDAWQSPAHGQTKTELLVIGPPTMPITTSTATSTITITTTIRYRPSLVPGNSQYILMGCYSQPTESVNKKGGRIFGDEEHHLYSAEKPVDKFTISACLEGCGSTVPPGNDTKQYMYAGIRNGSECMCGMHLSQEAHKASDEECTTPCPGDRKSSCGGKLNIAIYSLVSGSSTNTLPSVTNGKGESPQTAAAASKDAILTPSAGGPPRLVSAPTIAAITGSFSGAIIIAAALILCLRAQRRKRRVQDAHSKAMLERKGRSWGEPIITNVEGHDIALGAANLKGKDVKGETRIGGGGGGHRKLYNLFPSTPALESGRNTPIGLHARGTGSGSASARTSPRDERDTNGDSLYNTLMGEVRAGPADAGIDTGASSAVQWFPAASNHHAGVSPTSTTYSRRISSSGIAAPTQSAVQRLHPTSNHHAGVSPTQYTGTTYDRRVSSSGIAAPMPSAKNESEHTWHRRKLSMPYQPFGAGQVRRDMASAGPRSGPPTAPDSKLLPPTPKPGSDTENMITMTPKNTSDLHMKENHESPLRPRRSFDTLTLRLSQYEFPLPNCYSNDAPQIPSDHNKPHILGMSHANANLSMPTLGRYGSRKTRLHSPTDESPILGRRQMGRTEDDKLDNNNSRKNTTVPVLPPIAPGERFDHKLWAATTIFPVRKNGFSGSFLDDDDDDDDESRFSSGSSVGTSILFTSEEFDRRR